MNNNKFDLLIFDWEGTLANVDFSTQISQGAELFSGVELGIKDGATKQITDRESKGGSRMTH